MAPAHSGAGQHVVRVEAVSQVYGQAAGGVTALQEVSITVGDGDFVSIVGPSGCGKSTLLRIIADLLAPTRGRVLIRGRSPREARAEHMLGLVGLEQVGGRYPWQLSGGMQQRVSIARALVFDPVILLMDEPFGALDELGRERMNGELQRIWSQTGKTVLFVTHSVPEAVFLSSRIVVMSPHPGRVVAEIEVDLPRPRTPETRTDARYFDVITKVRRVLYES